MRINKMGEREMRDKANVLRWASACLSLMMASGGLRAQEPPKSDIATPVAERAASELTEVIVTGSRTSQDGYTAPTPVTTISAEQMLRATPTNLPDALNQLPQFANSLSQRNGNPVDNSQQGGGNSLDLRGLGPNRVLVLLDGQRVAPNNALGYVDINTFPQLLVSSVDVVTAGVSAVYGADAVSGVVNFVLDKKFEGIRGFLQGGSSSRDDNDAYAGGIALGTSLANERLHLLLSAEYNSSDGIPRFSSRPHGGEGWMRVGSGTAADPYFTVPNVRHTGASFGGFIGTGPLAGMTFQPDGSLAPFDFGQPLSRGYQIGGDGADWGDSTLMAALKTANVFGRADYEVSDNVKAHVQASYARSENKIDHSYFNYDFYDFTIFQDNAFLSQDVRDLLAATNTPGFLMGRINRDFGYVGNESENKSLRLGTGLEGSLSGSWNWKTDLTYGESKFNGEILNQTKPVELAAALDAVRAPNGEIVCNITLTNPGLRDDCVPLNIFGEGMPSQATINYVAGTTLYDVTNDALEVGAEVSGDLISLPSGPLVVALGTSYRRESIHQSSNSDTAIPIDATGVRGVFSTSAFTQTNFASAKGTRNVKELFFEATAPILAGLPLIHRLTLNGAARHVDYSSFGSKFVWKAGLVHEFTPEVRFRLTRSRDIRAPTLYNQFAGEQRVLSVRTDPLTQTSGLLLSYGGGNPDLDPEVGDTLSFGIGYEPEWLPGLRISADYYDVEIREAINNLSTEVVLSVCHDSGYTDPLCDLITRPFPITNTSPENFPTAVNSLSDFNIGSLRTKGIDFELSYNFNPRFMPGNISLRLIADYVDTFQINNAPGLPSYEYVGFIGRGLLRNFDAGLPQWRGTLSLTYDNGPFSIFVQERFIDSMSQIGGNTSDDVYGDGSDRVPRVFYTDLSLDYKVGNSGVKMFLSVNNLFDKDAPLTAFNDLPNILYPAVSTVYDLAGRYMTLGLRARF